VGDADQGVGEVEGAVDLGGGGRRETIRGGSGGMVAEAVDLMDLLDLVDRMDNAD
jgi:hypothetical protein